MNQMTQYEIGAKYTAASTWYDAWMSVLEALFLGRLRRALLRKARGRVLEVGIGTGLNLEHYLSECEVTGIEYTPAMLEKAKERAKRLGRKVRLIQGDVQKLSFKRGSFDTVVDTFCLCTYPNPEKALREMKRVCKKGGRILLLEHGRSSNVFVEKLQQWREEPHYRAMGCRLRMEYDTLLRKEGLRIVYQERKLFGIFYIVEAES